MTATPLTDIISAEIAQTGPIPTARYMELCLSHPQHGYYAVRDPLGTNGDFTTAPEISQMFGEMVGIWVASVWHSMGRPDFNLVELGPGRGTLMADVLRVLRQTGAEPDIWMVETSSTLRAEQAKRVPQARWATAISNVPEGPMILIANEFLDALPVHQYLRTPQGWREQQVGLVNGQLAFGLSEPVPDRKSDADWLEVSPMADAVTADIATRLSTAPGAALLIDYGYNSSDVPPGLTLQAVQNHTKVSPMHDPGDCDLTWLIDFDRIRNLLQTAGTTCMLTQQGRFLANLGIGQRAESLATAKPGEANSIADALERLTAPDQMGTLFKVLAATSSNLPPPPGFESLP